MHVWWIRRDARILDNAALSNAAAAAKAGESTLIVTFIYDPRRCKRATHGSHVVFVNEGLKELNQEFARRTKKGGIAFRVGLTEDALQGLAEEAGKPIHSIHSHFVVGDLADRSIDNEVQAWCCKNGVLWNQYDQYGLRYPSIEDLGISDEERRVIHTQESQIPCPQSWPPFEAVGFGHPSKPATLSVAGGRRPEQEHGGASAAQAKLDSWVETRGAAYNAEKSNPSLAWDSNSRLGPYLAWGHVSLRSVVQTIEGKRDQLATFHNERMKRSWNASLDEIISRLHLRVSFCQGVLDAPQMLLEPRHSGFHGVRLEKLSGEQSCLMNAWLEGKTGYPMIDACMRCFQRSGWLNMRMRAMVLSFAAYDLFLDWRLFADAMAMLMLDYEPGIHFYQMQSGSGTDGIEYRMYNPAKQLWDHDPEGKFVRKYVPELACCPLEHLAEPWMMPVALQLKTGVIIGQSYPHPIVNHTDALRHARAMLAPINCRASAALRASMPKEERPCGASLSLAHQREEASAARGHDLEEMRRDHVPFLSALGSWATLSSETLAASKEGINQEKSSALEDLNKPIKGQRWRRPAPAPTSNSTEEARSCQETVQSAPQNDTISNELIDPISQVKDVLDDTSCSKTQPNALRRNRFGKALGA